MLLKNREEGKETTTTDSTQIWHGALGPVSRKPRKVFWPVKPLLDHLYLKTVRCIRLKRVVWRELPFNYRIFEQNSSVIARFEILQWLYGPEKFPGLSRNGPQDSNHCICCCETCTCTDRVLMTPCLFLHNRFLLMADFDAYVKCQERVSEVFQVSIKHNRELFNIRFFKRNSYCVTPRYQQQFIEKTERR